MAVQRLRQKLAAWSRPQRWRESVAQAMLEGLDIPDPDGTLGRQIQQQLESDPALLRQTLLQARLQPDVARSHVPRMLTELLGSKPLPNIVSLGTHCFTSGLLRRWGLRSTAGPFDWTFSSVGMVAHCIDDDFVTFLDRSQYQPVPVEQRKAGPTANRVNHAYYLDKFHIEFVFNHHDVHLPEDYAHFERTVQRFRAGLRASDFRVYLLTRWHTDNFLDELAVLRASLARHASNYRLIAYSVRENQHPAAPRLTPVLNEPDTVAYVFDPISRWEPLQFPDLLDEHCLVHSVLAHSRP